MYWKKNNYSYFGSCYLFIFRFLGDNWVPSVLDPPLRRRCTKSKIGLVIGIVNSHGLAWAKWTAALVVFYGKGQSLTVLPFACFLCFSNFCQLDFLNKNFCWTRKSQWSDNLKMKFPLIYLWLLEVHVCWFLHWIHRCSNYWMWSSSIRFENVAQSLVNKCPSGVCY